MNGGQACQTTGETRKATFHADVRGLCGAPSEPPPSSGRSEAATQPYDAYADTRSRPSSIVESRPQWCVDSGALLLTMTTFELWEALERGEVLAWMRVWREGMECWTPVGELADFAWALATIPAPAPASELPADAHTGPLATPTVTPEPPPPVDGQGRFPAESAVRPVIRPLRGAGWIALGSAVALAALISAIIVRLAAPPAAPVASSGASAPAETAVVVRPSVPADPPGLQAAHHDERGQRRLPRGGRRAYGR